MDLVYESPIQKKELDDDDEKIRSSLSMPENVEITRKCTNFRVVMERKLGVDWEHTPQERRESMIESV
jgi:hypothetical protein